MEQQVIIPNVVLFEILKINQIGTNCQMGANPCLNTPCQNGGSCTISANNYLCQCIPPNGGTNCQLTINVCTPNPCFNNGACIRSSNISDGTYRCVCLNGYVGARCEYGE
jgi:hypothetical protein